MKDRKDNWERVSTGAPWENKVGYCRAVKIGDLIAVSGTAPVEDNGTVHAPSDPYRQTKRCLEIIERALNKLGSSKDKIFRTRVFVTDIKMWESIGRAHAEFFTGGFPASSMIEIKSLIHPDMLVEIEADALG